MMEEMSVASNAVFPVSSERQSREEVKYEGVYKNEKHRHTKRWTVLKTKTQTTAWRWMLELGWGCDNLRPMIPSTNLSTCGDRQLQCKGTTTTSCGQLFGLKRKRTPAP